MSAARALSSSLLFLVTTVLASGFSPATAYAQTPKYGFEVTYYPKTKVLSVTMPGLETLKGTPNEFKPSAQVIELYKRYYARDVSEPFDTLYDEVQRWAVDYLFRIHAADQKKQARIQAKVTECSDKISTELNDELDELDLILGASGLSEDKDAKEVRAASKALIVAQYKDRNPELLTRLKTLQEQEMAFNTRRSEYVGLFTGVGSVAIALKENPEFRLLAK